jgi:hypothetical protein
VLDTADANDLRTLASYHEPEGFRLLFFAFRYRSPVRMRIDPFFVQALTDASEIARDSRPIPAATIRSLGARR